MIQLRTKNLKKYYQRGPHLIKALDGIDLEVERGCFLAVMGISGSGKSTLLHLLGGLDEPTEGRVQIGEVVLDHLDEEEKSVFRRRKIGFIFQNYNLAPMLNIYENIVFPLTLDGRKPDEELLRSIISFLRLEDLLDAFPGELSGGQQQRAAIARALIAKPPVVLADVNWTADLVRQSLKHFLQRREIWMQLYSWSRMTAFRQAIVTVSLS